MAIHPDTGYVYLIAGSLWYDDRILVISGLETIASLPSDSFLNEATVNLATGLVYVTDTNDEVLIISGTEVIATVGVGEVPDYVAANPASGYVYAAERGALPEIMRNDR